LEQSEQEDWRFNRILGKKVPPEWPQLRVTRISFASTKPAAAAALVSALLKGGVPSATIDTANTVAGCVETHSIQLSDQTGESFELAWVHRPADKQGTASLALLEQYALEIRGDFSERSWRNWEHLMDYHVGVTHQQCKPMISRLKANSVGFFIAEQGSHNELFVSIFFQDATGIVYGVVCLDQLSQADFCELLSVPEFYYNSCYLDPNAFNDTQSLRLISQANQLQGLDRVSASPAVGNKAADSKWSSYALLTLALVVDDPGNKKIGSFTESGSDVYKMVDRCSDKGKDFITLGDSITSATDITSIICKCYDNKWRSIWRASDYCTWTVTGIEASALILERLRSPQISTCDLSTSGVRAFAHNVRINALSRMCNLFQLAHA
jgi:hypothetical protein